jgi:hypothetical protein
MRQSVNKKITYGFDVSTSDATSTSIVSAANIASCGGSTIVDIHMIVEGGPGYLGLGQAATTTPGKDIIPFREGTFDFENANCSQLNMIRDGGDIRVTGWVVIV